MAVPYHGHSSSCVALLLPVIFAEQPWLTPPLRASSLW
jgi:hypothetical protein